MRNRSQETAEEERGAGDLECINRYNGQDLNWQFVRLGLMNLTTPTGRPYRSFAAMRRGRGKDAAVKAMCGRMIAAGKTLDRMRREDGAHLVDCAPCRQARARMRGQAPKSTGQRARTAIERAVAQQ